MKTRDLVAMGIPAGAGAGEAKRLLQEAQVKNRSVPAVIADLRRIVESPASFTDDERYGALARELMAGIAAGAGFRARENAAPYRAWGTSLEPAAVEQMQNACKIPVAVSGALMPDAHVGYGLPIGGVLATRDAVIPYAVGVDIACRMKMSVLELPVDALDLEQSRLTRAIERETRFGTGATSRRSGAMT
jgi:tRNA-splicing ligase RtcB